MRNWHREPRNGFRFFALSYFKAPFSSEWVGCVRFSHARRSVPMRIGDKVIEHRQRPVPASVDDADLICRTRDGDSEAYGVLFARHRTAGTLLAFRYARGQQAAEDLVADAFTRVLASLKRGNGPTTDFRNYLFTTIRRTAITGYAKTDPEIDIADFGSLEHSAQFPATPPPRIFGDGVIGDAFLSLPPRWQQALWYIEVEGLPVGDAAKLLGLTANSTSALVYRAREGLRTAYLENYVRADRRHECPSRRDLVAYVRGKCGEAVRARVHHHVEACDGCAAAADDISHVGVKLRALALPLLAGGFGLGAGASLLQTQQAQALAVTPVLISGRKQVAREIRRSLRNTGVTTIGAVGLVAATTMVCVSALSPSIPKSHPGEAPAAVTTHKQKAAADPAVSVPLANTPVAAPPIPTYPGVPLVDRVPQKVVAADDAPAQKPLRTKARSLGPSSTPDRVDPGMSSPEGHSPVLNLPLSDVAGSMSAAVAEGQPAAAYEGLMETTMAGPMPCPSIAGGAYHLDGSSSFLHTSAVTPALQTFTIAIWFRTSTPGGKLIGYGDAATGASTSYDRHLYLTDQGELVFGVFAGEVRTIQSPAAYTDGNWHHAVATLSNNGMRLYVDGSQVGVDASVTSAQPDYAGYWRIGYDTLEKWGPTTPGNHYYTGDLRCAQIYSEDLGAADIAQLYQTGLST